MTDNKTTLIDDNNHDTLDGNALPQEADLDRQHVTQKFDPILDTIFSALGVDGSYLNATSPLDRPTATPVGPESQDACTATESGSRPWILHVDDDTDLSNALKLRLEAYGVTVVQAIDGIDGVRHAFTRPADAIILDYQMPRGDGQYVLKRLKQCPATKHIPIIVLTGRRDQGLEQQMLNLGAARFLNKPIRFDMMLDVLRQFVPLQQPRGESCLMA